MGIAGQLKKNRLVAAARAFQLDLKRKIGDRGIQPRFEPERTREVVAGLQSRGWFVLPELIDADECDRLRAQVDEALDRYRDHLKVYDEHDRRLYGADRVCDAFADFFHRPQLVEVLKTYAGTHYYGGFCMAAHMKFAPGNKGSGGGWHRDSAYGRQTKAIVYLTDVSEENGPFQYLEGSHHTSAFVRMILSGKQTMTQTRFDDGSYDARFDADDTLRTFTAPKGTVIMADTRGLHRGKPIAAGERYALTNYYGVLDQYLDEKKYRLVSREEVERIGRVTT